MGRNKTSNKSVLADVSNVKHNVEGLKAGQQEDGADKGAQKLALNGTERGGQPIVTFMRKAKVSFCTSF